MSHYTISYFSHHTAWYHIFLYSLNSYQIMICYMILHFFFETVWYFTMLDYIVLYMLILSYIICFDVIRYFSSYGILFGYYHRLMISYCIVFAFIEFAFSKCNIVIYYGRKEVLKSNFWQCGQMKSRDEKCQWTEEKKKE